jgi:hypothetical protein
MRIKKHSNGNEYLLTEASIWVRNFTKEISPIDINAVTERKDYNIIVENEIKNNSLDLSEIDTDKIKYSKAVIISDGYDFDRRQQLLLNLPNDVIIIATNRTLVKWKINKKIDYFVVNNPYKECLLQMPKHKYYPSCVASSRTYHDFLKEYDRRGGVIHKYASVREETFSPALNNIICSLDDYRNPICASISLAYKFGVNKLLLFCCDNAFAESRPTAEQLYNGKWIYPQQRMSHAIVEGMFYWYLKEKAQIRDYSSGPEYKEVSYISEDEIVEFFN